MRTATVATIVWLLISGRSSAHRLDEYLQAARVSLARDQIVLNVELTPGANIASAVIAVFDRDRDGVISPDEAHAYGRAVLADLVMKFDDRAVGAALTRVEVPSISEMGTGLGTIRLRAVGHIEVTPGRHAVYFRNNHQPGMSVYMINALIPEDEGIAVLSQTRDSRQREARIAYEVAPVTVSLP